jgi:hypothetical protein
VTLQDRPTAPELLEAVREYLERDVMAADELSGRVRFHARVAVNVLGIVERELRLGPGLDATERERLAALLGQDGEVDDLLAELASGIRDGSFDDRRDEVLECVRESVRAKLAVANPEYLES